MKEQEIQELRVKFAPRECESQIEFERLMAELQDANAQAAHPHLDTIASYNKELLLMDMELHELHAKMDQLKVKRMYVEKDLKETNRFFHDLKHQLVMLNPREKFVKQENEQDV